MGERANLTVSSNVAFCNETRVQNHYSVFNSGRSHANVRVDPTTGADHGIPFQKDIWIKHRVGAYLNVWLHVGGRRIYDRDAIFHELIQFSITDHPLDFCEFAT